MNSVCTEYPDKDNDFLLYGRLEGMDILTEYFATKNPFSTFVG